MSSRNPTTFLVLACVLAIVATPCQPASAESLSGSDSRPTATRIFAATSPYYRALPDKTPKAATSSKLIASLNSQAHKFYGTRSLANVNVNTTRFAPALYVAYNSDPVFDVMGWNCQYKKVGWDVHLNRQLRNVHIPADLQPDPSTDGSVSIYNADTKELVELWKTRQVDGQWQACWGGRISEADQADGRFTSSFGASASGLALWGVTIKQQELLDGHIDHVIGLALPYTKKVGSSRVDLQACKLEYSIVSPK